MRQWGLAFHMYADDNNDYVPEEGDTMSAINSTGSSTATDNLDYAWYNCVAPTITQPPLVKLYGAFSSPFNPPLPQSSTIFSDPGAPDPNPAFYKLDTALNGIKKTYFMYGENTRLCVNFSSRTTSPFPAQTKLANIVRPTDTIFLAEVNGNAVNPDGTSSATAANSTVSGYYSIARHSHNKLGNFSMCDGSSRSARTNDFWEPQTIADGLISNPVNTGQAEWSTPRAMYWYPSSSTPN
jgi:hypothetical protein